MNEMKKFWFKLFGNPVRLIAIAVMFLAIWINAGWIFHPIHSTVVLIGSIAIILAITAFIGGAGYLQKINWRNSLHQRIATRSTVAVCALVIFYFFYGRYHTFIFTVIAAVIVAVALKDVIKMLLK